MTVDQSVEAGAMPTPSLDRFIAHPGDIVIEHVNQEVQDVMESKGLSFQEALEYIDVKNGGTGDVQAVSQETLTAEAQALFQEGDV